MKKILLAFAFIAASTQAAIPTLSGLAETLENLRTGFEARLSTTSNRLAEATARIDELRADLVSVAKTRDALVLLVDGDRSLRERFHGGRIGQYILTNETGRIIRVDLYGDGNCWTNGMTYAVDPTLDPEAHAKAIAEAAAKAAEERERVQAAWEAANLPPNLAALRARQREAARQTEEAEEQ